MPRRPAFLQSGGYPVAVAKGCRSAMADPVLSAPPAPPLDARLAAWLRGLLATLLLVLLVVVVLWPRPAWGLPSAASMAPEAAEGPRLFDLHCAGCHPNGGNVIRRGRTLRQADLLRQGIEGEAAIATIAAEGIGRMDGYATVLGDGGPELVASWVWQQAQAGWPRRP